MREANADSMMIVAKIMMMILKTHPEYFQRLFSRAYYQHYYLAEPLAPQVYSFNFVSLRADALETIRATRARARIRAAQFLRSAQRFAFTIIFVTSID